MPQPVVTFLRHSAMLRSAMAECLDEPTPKTVHLLRSTTRRIEATLGLLTDSADLTNLPKRCKAFRRSFRRVRRAAGNVRDFDVHRELLARYKTIADAASLEKDLQAERKRTEKKLRQQILRDQDDIRRTLDKIETVLAPAVDFNLSGGSLARSAQSWLAATLRGLDPKLDEDLHSIRKACKTARYIAEIGSDASKSAARLADRLEDIQQTTGAWHDYLILSNEAHTSLPNGSILPDKLRLKAAALRRKAESKAARLLAS